MLILSGRRTNRSLHLPARILEGYKKPYLGPVTYTVQRVSATPDSQGCVLGTAPAVGMVGRMYTQGRGGGEEPLPAPVQLVGQLEVTSSPSPPLTSTEGMQHGECWGRGHFLSN